MPHFFKATVFIVFALALSACSSKPSGKDANWRGFTQSGQASYYADKYNNRKTASGEIYHHKFNTAAHRELPFGSKVKVTNIKNGKTVVVTINDRGPFIRGRIIDLSKSAFSRIGNTAEGLLEVTIQVID